MTIDTHRGFHFRSSFCAQFPLCNFIPRTDEGTKYNFRIFLSCNFVPPVLNRCVSDCLHVTPLCSHVVAGRYAEESSSKEREKWLISLFVCVYITRTFFYTRCRKSRNSSVQSLAMDLAVGIVILLVFIFDKSSFGHHPNFYQLGAISWTERNAEYSFSFTVEVKHTWTATAVPVPECRNAILLNTQTALCFCLHLCPLFWLYWRYIAIILNEFW